MLLAVERKGRSSQQRPSLLAGTTGAAAACSIIEVASRPGSSTGVRRRPLDGGLRHSDGVDAQPLCLQQRKLLLTGGTAALCQQRTHALEQTTRTLHRDPPAAAVSSGFPQLSGARPCLS